MADERYAFPASLILEHFDPLVVATGNKLDREWPSHLPMAAGELLRSMVLSSENTYRTIRYFCADEPHSYVRKREFAFSATPLVRTILEALFTTVFLCDDIKRRTPAYFKAGWREWKEKHDRLAQEYATNPSWDDWLRDHAAAVADAATTFGITTTEQLNPSRLPRWPLPSQMIAALKSEQRRSYLLFMRDWFYRELSQDAHLTWPGLLRRGAYLLTPTSQRTPEIEDTLDKYKSDVIITTVVILLALMSELEIELHFGHDERLKYVWTLLVPVWGDAEEIYERFYKDTL